MKTITRAQDTVAGRSSWALLLLLAWLDTGCTGQLTAGPVEAGQSGRAPQPAGPPSPPRQGSEPESAVSEPSSPRSGTCTPALLPQRVRRLTRAEYTNIVSGWLGSGGSWQDALPPDPGGRSLSVDADGLVVGSVQFEAYARVAQEIASSGAIERVAACLPSDTDAACLQRLVRGAVPRLFGRPESPEDLTSLQPIFAAGLQEVGAGRDGARAAGLRAVGRALLQSPQLLYVSELGEGDAPTAALTPLEIASQMSLLLLGTRPDDDLLSAAMSGTLKQPAERRRHAARLAATPLARARLRGIIRDWFALSDLSDLEKNESAVPVWSESLRASMGGELDHFVDHALGPGGGTVAALFDGSSSFVDGTLASAVYRDEVSGVKGTTFTAVRLDPKRRRGILSLPAFLAGHSGPGYTSPVERGLAVRRGLLCQTVPSPPPGVSDEAVASESGKSTTRQKFERHLNEPACRACHESFDPIGFGMEQMDVVGRFRTEEAGLPVDSTGRLSGTDVDGAFEGPAALSMMLARSEDVRFCFVSQLLRVANARGTGVDTCRVQRLHERLKAGKDQAIEAIVALVEADEFVLRGRPR